MTNTDRVQRHVRAQRQLPLVVVREKRTGRAYCDLWVDVEVIANSPEATLAEQLHIDGVAMKRWRLRDDAVIRAHARTNTHKRDQYRDDETTHPLENVA